MGLSLREQRTEPGPRDSPSGAPLDSADLSQDKQLLGEEEGEEEEARDCRRPGVHGGSGKGPEQGKFSFPPFSA